MGAGKHERRVGQVPGDLVGGIAQRRQVGRIEVDGVQVGDPHPVVTGPPFALHRTLDPALDLDRLEPGSEQASRGPFEEALEQALEAR